MQALNFNRMPEELSATLFVVESIMFDDGIQTINPAQGS